MSSLEFWSQTWTNFSLEGESGFYEYQIAYLVHDLYFIYVVEAIITLN